MGFLFSWNIIVCLHQKYVFLGALLDTGLFWHRYTDFGHTDLGELKFNLKLKDDTNMMSMKIVQFSIPPPPSPLSIYVQNSSTPLTLDV